MSVFSNPKINNNPNSKLPTVKNHQVKLQPMLERDKEQFAKEWDMEHKNLVYKTFNTECVMRWRLIIEECGPKLTYIKGKNNIVADVGSLLFGFLFIFGFEKMLTSEEPHS